MREAASHGRTRPVNRGRGGNGAANLLADRREVVCSDLQRVGSGGERAGEQGGQACGGRKRLTHCKGRGRLRCERCRRGPELREARKTSDSTDRRCSAREPQVRPTRRGLHLSRTLVYISVRHRTGRFVSVPYGCTWPRRCRIAGNDMISTAQTWSGPRSPGRVSGKAPAKVNNLRSFSRL